MKFRLRWAFALAVTAISAPGMSIVLNANASLSGNAAALAAFQRAANTWQGMFSDPITVNINAGLASLGPGIIGSAGSTLYQTGYNNFRSAMILDASDEASNGIVAALPTAAQFLGQLPAGGFSFSSNIVATSANFKALGFALPAGSDGDITFSDNFGFDYDNSDGVLGGMMDFESVALHEIGHVLGFISAVDQVDYLKSQAQVGTIYLHPLDLFRFSSANLPTNAAQFTANARSVVPGAAAHFSDTSNTWGFSTGMTQGDGRQASHWKDDDLTGIYIGIMDPTLDFGTIELAKYADARAFDLVGYDLVAVPEPGTFALMGVGLASLAYWRKRRS
jgi:hypothetical protein